MTRRQRVMQAVDDGRRRGGACALALAILLSACSGGPPSPSPTTPTVVSSSPSSDLVVDPSAPCTPPADMVKWLPVLRCELYSACVFRTLTPDDTSSGIKRVLDCDFNAFWPVPASEPEVIEIVQFSNAKAFQAVTAEVRATTGNCSNSEYGASYTINGKAAGAVECGLGITWSYKPLLLAGTLTARGTVTIGPEDLDSWLAWWRTSWAASFGELAERPIKPTPTPRGPIYIKGATQDVIEAGWKSWSSKAIPCERDATRLDCLDEIGQWVVSVSADGSSPTRIKTWSAAIVGSAVTDAGIGIAYLHTVGPFLPDDFWDAASEASRTDQFRRDGLFEDDLEGVHFILRANTDVASGNQEMSGEIWAAGTYPGG